MAKRPKSIVSLCDLSIPVITEIAAFENIELIAVKTLSWPTRILIMVKKKIQIQKL